MDIKITIKAEVDESTSTCHELAWMLNFLHLKHLESRTTLIDSYYLNVPEVK